MAVKLLDLQLIYGVAGAREKFEQLVQQIIKAEYSEASTVRVKNGDGGIDIHVGELTDPKGIDVYQCKFFPLGLKPAQKSQIIRSFETCNECTEYRAKTWTLCLPIDLAIDEKTWLETWKNDKSANSSIDIRFKGALELESLLHQEKNRSLKEYYFKEQHLAQIREVHSMLTCLIPDIVGRLNEQESERQQKREDDLASSFHESRLQFQTEIQKEYRSLTAPPPLIMSNWDEAQRMQDRKRIAELNDLKQPAGHWEIVVHPSRPLDALEIGTLSECQSIIEQSAVNLNSRSFPSKNLDKKRSGQNWISYSSEKGKNAEYWAICQHRIFIHLQAIEDDFLPRALPSSYWEILPTEYQGSRYFDIDRAIRQITYAYRFASNFANSLTLTSDESIDIRLRLTETRNRILVTRDDPNRMISFNACNMPNLDKCWRHQVKELQESVDELAANTCIWVFERFNWRDVNVETIKRLQRRLFDIL